MQLSTMLFHIAYLPCQTRPTVVISLFPMSRPTLGVLRLTLLFIIIVNERPSIIGMNQVLTDYVIVGI